MVSNAEQIAKINNILTVYPIVLDGIRWNEHYEASFGRRAIYHERDAAGLWDLSYDENARWVESGR